MRQIQTDPFLMYVLHTVPLTTSFLERTVVTGFMRMHEFLRINLKTISPSFQPQKAISACALNMYKEQPKDGCGDG